MCTCNENKLPYNPCNACNETPCIPKEDCTCPIKDLNTDCIVYTGDDLKCTNIKGNQTLTDIIKQLDSYFCTLREEFLNLLSFVNTGIGAKVFKGVDLLGRKQFRKINNGASTLVQVTENTDDISVTINEENLTEFIQDNQKTYSVSNVGSGAKIYKQTTTTGNNRNFEFKSIKIDSQNGDGETFVRDIQQNTNDITVLVKKIKSDTLTITATDTEISLDLAESSQIPALYVNNLYVPSYPEWVSAGGDLTTNPSFQYKGEGTLSKPFTDSINYTSPTTRTITPNTAIQNALDAYVGDTTIYSRLNPQLSGQQIIIQKNNTSYLFQGDFNYSSLNLLIEGYVFSNTTGWLVDMDNPLYFNSNSSFITIRIGDEGILQLTDSLGFRNSGNTSSTPPAFDTGRIISLLGNGLIYSSYNGVDALNRYIINSEGNFNDLNLHFQVKCRLRADYQGVYLAKNYARYDFYNTIQSGNYLGSVNTNLQAFRMTGGQVRFYENGAITISSETSSRSYGITFEPENDGIGYCSFQLNSARVGYSCNYLFAKLNDENVNFLAFNSIGVGSTTFPLGSNAVINGLFENTGVTPWGVEFRNCVYQFTGIDHNKVDLTNGNNISSINTIGSNVIETLVVYNNRANAIAAGVPLYSTFLNRSAPSIPEGSEPGAFPLTGKWYRDIVLPN